MRFTAIFVAAIVAAVNAAAVAGPFLNSTSVSQCAVATAAPVTVYVPGPIQTVAASTVTITEGITTSTSSEDGPYYYRTEFGTTIWFNGHAPVGSFSATSTSYLTITLAPGPMASALVPADAVSDYDEPTSSSAALTAPTASLSDTKNESITIYVTSTHYVTTTEHQHESVSWFTDTLPTLVSPVQTQVSPDTSAAPSSAVVETSSILSPTTITATASMPTSWAWTGTFVNATATTSRSAFSNATWTYKSLTSPTATISGYNTGHALATYVTVVCDICESSVRPSFTRSFLSTGVANSTQDLSTFLSTITLDFPPKSSVPTHSSTTQANATIARTSASSVRVTSSSQVFSAAPWSNSSSVGTKTSSMSTSLLASGTKTSTGGPTPSVCGEYGDFTLNWDDLPPFFTNDPDLVQGVPIFNPYHHLFFSDGYSYVPPPKEPFPPTSGPRLAMFNPFDHDEDGPGVYLGMIGAGPRAPVDAYWFNAHGAAFGCDYGEEGSCTLVVSGHKWDDDKRSEVLVTTHNFTLPSCPGFDDCHLQRVDFGDDYTGISGLQLEMFVNETVPRTWWMDDLDMGWWNNTCAAGLLRISTR